MALMEKYMFTIPTTQKEIFEAATKFYASIPHTPEDVKEVFEKVQNVVKTEYENSQTMVKTYQKASVNAATAKEISDANRQAKELVKASAFFGLVCIPGALFMLPSIIKSAEEYDIDLVPKSVSDQFGI